VLEGIGRYDVTLACCTRRNEASVAQRGLWVVGGMVWYGMVWYGMVWCGMVVPPVYVTVTSSHIHV
jgi:hypothetical protein